MRNCDDPAMQVAAQRESDAEMHLASPSTLSRLENRVNSKTIFQLHEILVDTFLDSYGKPPEEIILDMDATEEPNRIKEQQLCLFADRTSCTDFMANQFRLILAGFAYVLVDGIRRLGLAGTDAHRWRVDTIRLRLLKIAARVRVSARRVIFHLASGCPYESLFNRVASRLCDSGYPAGSRGVCDVRWIRPQHQRRTLLAGHRFGTLRSRCCSSFSP